MITLRMIAEVSGYSRSSVWMAINGHPKQSRKTQEKILKIAKEMGYRPNPAYRSMLQQARAGKPIEYRSTLGLLHGFNIPDPEKHDEFHRKLVEGIIERANEFGYEVETFWLSQSGMSGQRLFNILKARGIKGIIVTPLAEHRWLDLDFDQFATIAISFTILNPGLNRIEINNQDATAVCIRKLFEHGYERIGFVQRSEYEMWREYNLLAPYLWMTSKLPKNKRPEVFFAESGSRNDFLKWWHKGKFDSLICNYEDVVEWLEEEGIHTPDDYGVVFPTPTYGHLDFAHVNPHPGKLGAAATDALIAQLQRGEYGLRDNPKTLTTDVSWLDGKSIRKVGPQKHHFSLRLQ